MNSPDRGPAPAATPSGLLPLFQERSELTGILSVLRHDLRSPVGHILGFAEMLLEEAETRALPDLKTGLNALIQCANECMALITEKFEPAKFSIRPKDMERLKNDLGRFASQLTSATHSLIQKVNPADADVFVADLHRIGSAAQRLEALAQTIPEHLLDNPNSSRPSEMSLPLPGDTEFVGARLDAAGALPKQGRILVVDDLEENRELLKRRLSRLGYSVDLAFNGRQALEHIQQQPADLILLDIMMPELNGFETLKILKQNPASRHVPVIMLSSSDELDTAVRCIQLGADDFLPKPFNTTLLLARIESSLAKKRWHDQEKAFLLRLQTEQERSERLLLNILPKPIADRLKHGESNIADSFSEVTVLFTDFVGFTRLASAMPAKELVRSLNEIFSSFDALCERFELEKIKMIGDAYMAVGGLPSLRPDHAQAVADLALAMHEEVARFAARGQPFQMRIGINTGPVIAGVIGAKKFAYDLWGDTVNLASRMETNAPAGGTLVTAATYEILRDQFRFQEGQYLEVKGKGQTLTYLLLGRRGEEVSASQ